jgi:hypothetical protein
MCVCCAPDINIFWHPQGDYLAVKVDRFTKTRKSTYTGFELFSIREKGIPMDVSEPNGEPQQCTWAEHMYEYSLGEVACGLGRCIIMSQESTHMHVQRVKGEAKAELIAELTARAATHADASWSAGDSSLNMWSGSHSVITALTCLWLTASRGLGPGPMLCRCCACLL